MRNSSVYIRMGATRDDVTVLHHPDGGDIVDSWFFDRSTLNSKERNTLARTITDLFRAEWKGNVA